MSKRIAISTIFISALLWSCVNSEDYRKLKQDFGDVEYDGKIENFDSIYSSIPDYTSISRTINKMHARFNSEILLDVQSADFYLNSKETSIALGMFVADLGYVRHFERVQLCMDYMEAVKTLAGKLAIGEKEFAENVPEIENSLNDKEKLFQIIDTLINSGDILLSGGEKYGISALFLGGFWLETTYIGLFSKNNQNIEDLNSILESHFEILSKINMLFDCLDDRSVLSEFKNALIELESKGFENENLKQDIKKIRDKYVVSYE